MSQAKFAGDTLERHARLPQTRDLVIAGLAVIEPVAGKVLGSRLRFRLGYRGRCRRRRLDRLADLSMMTVEHRLEGVGGVAQKMKTIGDLDRRGSALADAVGKGAGPVAGDDLGTGMLFEPRCQRLGLSVGQQVDRASAFEISEDRAVMLATAEGEVIDAKHTCRFGGLQDDRPNQAQHGVGAERHS
jgi:hypothetical protein